MIFIDPRKIEQSIPGELKKQLEDATAELVALPEAERAAYIERNKSLWGDVRPYLAAVTGKDQSQDDYKCWYCEDKTTRFTYHVDHFRPKGRVKDKGRDPEPGYWWLAFDYRNYRLSCEYCNTPHRDEDAQETRGKWDQFPLTEGSARAHDPDANIDDEIRLLIDPNMISEVTQLTFDDEGRARPLEEQGYVCELARSTITVLNLNDRRVVGGRRQIRENCLRLVKQGNEEYKKWRRGGSPAAKAAFDRTCEQILELVQPWSEFSAMARTCFKGSGKEWLLILLS